MGDNDKIAWRPPDVLGEPLGEMCEICHVEEAEHRVRTWGCKAYDMNAPGSGALFWDMCGTCLLRFQKEAQKTVQEVTDEDLRRARALGYDFGLDADRGA